MAIEDPQIITPDGKFIPCYFSGGVEAVTTNTWGVAASASLYVSHYSV